MRRRVRILVALVGALGVMGAPALAASFTVASSNLATFRTCTLTPLSGASTAGTDSWVNQNSPTTNNGTDTASSATSLSLNKNARIYLRFDLTKCGPAIPATATIDSAVLRMVPSAVATLCRTYDIFRVTASWSETTITWNNQPFGTAVNNPASASRTSSSNIGAAPCAITSVNAYTTGWDVTADVAAFVAGTATNNGWMIRDDVENASTTIRTTTFYARETNSVASAQLIVDYK